MTKQLTPLFLAGLMAAAVAPTASAASISLGEQILNGGFTINLASWNTSGVANQRADTDEINTSVGNAGFNGFFTLVPTVPPSTNGFAVLGDASGPIDGNNSGTSTLSQTFILLGTIEAVTVQSYDLTINFRTVFNGFDAGNSVEGADIFRATLNDDVLFSQESTGLPNANSQQNLQQVNDPFTEVLFGLLPGTYTLTFSLNETPNSNPNANGNTNTAAGVDAVSVNATANLVPEPSTLALVGAALLGLGLRRRRA